MLWHDRHVSEAKIQSWSVVLAGLDPNGDVAPERQACAGTLQAVLDAVVADQVTLLANDREVEKLAMDAGARTMRAGRDLNASIQRAVTLWADEVPGRSCAVIVGPLPRATASDIAEGLRSCAAAEAAMITTHDGKTTFLTHHDGHRIHPRFGGASAARHARVHTEVGTHVEALRVRTVEDDRTNQEGA